MILIRGVPTIRHGMVAAAQIAVSSLLSSVGQPSAVSVDFACPINFTIRDAQGAHVIVSEKAI